MIYQNGIVIDGGIAWENQPDGTPWTEEAAALFIAAEAARREAVLLANQPVARPSLVIMQILPDAATETRTSVTADLDDVTCPVGAVLSITAELRSPDGSLLPLTDNFRMPIRSRDGRERLLLVSVANGVASFSATMRESGVWKVTEELINMGLPEQAQMNFAGIEIFVFDA